MRKSRPKGRLRQRILPESLDLHVKLKSTIRRGLFDLCVQSGMQALQDILGKELDRLVGPRYRHDEERDAVRGGTAPTTVVLGGRKVHVRRPRARQIGGKEIRLRSLEMFASEDPLREHVMGEILAGASTRRYGSTLDPIPDGLDEFGTTRSAVSRHFVACTQEQMKKFLARPIGDLNLLVIMIDGVEAGGSCVAAALGVAQDGRKHVLGLQEGATENSEVVKTLLEDLIERGLDPKGSFLFVIDGSKALRKAIKAFFGERAAIQRCTIHKTRNVLDHLPQERRHLVRSALREAFRSTSGAEGRQRLKALAAKLQDEYPGAAASLREGVDDLFTVADLGITGKLLRFLQTTNAIENLFSSFRHVSRNVKRWRSGSMVLRWAATAMTHAGKKFRRVKGHDDLRLLAVALKPAARKEAVGA
ncbi:MAG: IS256 family transposase [Planctomycetia bacterium]|nr:IS256 family transposase [Planctomycetia bacterium]